MCEDLMKMTREFGWAEEGEKKHIHWSSWDKLIQKKSKGGWPSETLVFSTKLY
jgi:hypothetical protein